MYSFFMRSDDVALLVYGIYNPWLVALSVVVAVFTSTMALQIAGVAVLMRGQWQRQIALASGAITLGVGTWAMHFVGMLAFDLCTTVTYNISLTLFSVLPSLAASWIALDLMTRPSITNTQWIVGGGLVGGGVGIMHYGGMAAMQMEPLLRYDPAWFCVSLIVAMALAILSLRIRFGLRRLIGKRRLQPWQILVLSGFIMGLAIASMHYTGMLAARFVAPDGLMPDVLGSQADAMALLVSLATLMLTMLTAVGATVMLRYRQLFWQMRASEARLQAIVDTAANGLIMLDHLGAIKTFNPAAERMFGWKADEVIGKNARLLVHEAYGMQFERFLERHLNAGDTSMLGAELELDGVHRDGHALPFRVSVGKALLGDESVFVGFITDTRERKAMEQALKDSEQQYRSLMGNTPGMAFRRLMTPGWPLIVMSEGAAAVTGYTSDEFVSGKVSFRDLIFPDDLQRVEPMMQRAMNEKTPYASEFRIRHRDGSTRWVMSRGRVALDQYGEPRFFDGLIMDISDRREMEVALIAAKDRAELAAASRSAFLANMSHEIRTPMNAIIGFTEFLLDTELTPLQRRHLGTVRQSARSLLGLLNDILDTAKLEKGALELEQADFSLEALASEVVEGQRLTAESKGLSLQLQYDPTMSKFFKGDALRIRQVLSNLIGNAVKFTAKGFVRLEISDDEGHVHMKVCDSGIGIASDRLDKIFDPFSQADASMSRRYGGTGLGTTISRQLVDLMQGSLWVNSTLGMGSEFHVRLPLPAGNVVQESQEGLMFKLPPLNILVVDDVPQNLELLGLVLGKAGHEVVTASDGAQAVAAWQVRPFDVVLMDVQMPGMDGLEATRQIRQLEKAREQVATPIIALTASVLEKNRADTWDAGMNGFASKPIELSDLIAEIARVLGIAMPEGELGKPVTSASATSSAPVDWARGAELWGTAFKQEQGIRRLLSDQQGVCMQLDELLRAGEHESARQVVHRLRGAAGNLSLMALHTLTADMEHAIRAEDLDAAAASLPALEACIAEIWSELSLTAVESQGQHGDVHDEDSLVFALDSEEFKQLADDLIASMRRGELEDETLKQVCQALRGADRLDMAQELENAFDAFEFRRAEDLLRKILDFSIKNNKN